ncbi:SpoIIE family protein phosphatase [Streptomyces sp. NPDC055952]|uniref:SpoIIE family protein phosphatase n=1 Tax=Streptomyces sp. NPDC055952 TaxID=3345663 RepID=UPI0035DD05C2
MEPGPLPGIDTGVDALHPVSTTTLPAGALLALYTDALVEAPGADITESIATVADHLTTTGERPLDELADDLVRHALPTHAHLDDVALLLLRPR